MTSYLRYYIVKDEFLGEGYIVACSLKHAQERVGDMDGFTLTGDEEDADHEVDECEICQKGRVS